MKIKVKTPTSFFEEGQIIEINEKNLVQLGLKTEEGDWYLDSTDYEILQEEVQPIKKVLGENLGKLTIEYI